MAVSVLPSTVAVTPSGDEVTVYEVIPLPPSKGACQVTLAEPEPAVAVTLVGASGTVAAGVTAFDWSYAGPGPTTFAAVTVKV